MLPEAPTFPLSGSYLGGSPTWAKNTTSLKLRGGPPDPKIMWDAPDRGTQETPDEEAPPRGSVVAAEALLVMAVYATLFEIAPTLPRDDAEVGFVFGCLVVLVTAATLRFFADLADFATRD